MRNVRKRFTFSTLLFFLFAFLFFFTNTTCQTARQFSQSVHAPFCAAEQISAPTQQSFDHIKLILQDHPIFSFIAFISTLVLFFTFSFANPGIDGKQFNRLMIGRIIRYGPYQKQFLPYLHATHGM